MRVAFDIGGTFTDIIALDPDRRVVTAKALSLLDRVGKDVVKTVRHLLPEGQVDYVAHATTICSNALIEAQGAAVGLLTTAGFRDILELRSQRGPGSPNPDWTPPAPLVPRNLCLEIDERIDVDGKVRRPLDPAQVRAQVKRLVEAGVDSIAICFINAYANPAHELEAAAIIRDAAPDVVLSIASQIHPEIREYERFSTTAINASLVPVVRDYLARLEEDLSPLSRRLVIMQSNGGVMSAATARAKPMLMVESGPAAGVLAAARLAQAMGLDKVIAFDMGGTTAKACLIEHGVPLERPGTEVGGAATVAGEAKDVGHVLRAPTIDIVEVGAGGGSIAWAHADTLRVGPRSAGAQPGPVCYGRGGTRPTVTDANVALGYINDSAIADGALAIDRAAATGALEALGAELGLDMMATAYGVTQVANAVMMRAIRAVSIERGHDARDFTMIAFGGGGPLHAVGLAESMTMKRVVIPPYSGVFSALGLLLADYKLDFIRSMTKPLDAVPVAQIAAACEALKDQALEEVGRQGIATDGIALEYRVDLRYDYQLEEMTLPFDPGVAGDDVATVLRAAFMDAHRREFGAPGRGRIMLVNLRLRAIAQGSRASLADLRRTGRAPVEGPVRTRQAYFGPGHGLHATPVHRRETIAGRMTGPVIVEEPDTTIIVPPQWQVERDAQMNLIISRA